MTEFKGQTIQELGEGHELLLVDFFATWCGPCKMVMPVLETLETKDPFTHFVKVDIDKNRKEAINHKVSAVPTLVLFRDGVEVARRQGYAPEDELAKWINEWK